MRTDVSEKVLVLIRTFELNGTPGEIQESLDRRVLFGHLDKSGVNIFHPPGISQEAAGKQDKDKR